MEFWCSMGGTNTFIALFHQIYIIGLKSILSWSCAKSALYQKIWRRRWKESFGFKQDPQYENETKRIENDIVETTCQGEIAQMIEWLLHIRHTRVQIQSIPSCCSVPYLKVASFTAVCFRRQTQLIMNRSWSRTLIVVLLQWLDYKTLQLLLLCVPMCWFFVSLANDVWNTKKYF